MVCGVHPEHPDITGQMWEQIDKIIEDHQHIPGAVIAVLRKCQNIVGYLPPDLINYISKGMNIPSSTVYGVASFYELFSFVPKGRHTIKVCMGTACYVKGSREVVNRIRYLYHIKEGETSEDRRFSLESVRCLGACGLAPVMVVDGDTYGNISPDQIFKILENYQ